MKRFLISAGILTTVLPSTANAKGCIKGAIVGGLARHMAGHGKVGAVAGCVIGRHEALPLRWSATPEAILQLVQCGTTAGITLCSCPCEKPSPIFSTRRRLFAAP